MQAVRVSRTDPSDTVYSCILRAWFVCPSLNLVISDITHSIFTIYLIISTSGRKTWGHWVRRAPGEEDALPGES